MTYNLIKHLEMISAEMDKGNSIRCLNVEGAIEAALKEINQLTTERDALKDALIEIKEWTERYTQPGHPIVTFADKALAKLKGE